MIKQPEAPSILPFSNQQKQLVDDLLHNFNDQQLTWLAGYLTGISLPQSIKTVAQPHGRNQVPVEVNTDRAVITVLFGSRTGNGSSVAKRLKAEAEARGLGIRLEDMNEYPLAKLKDEKYLLVIVSTHGEGVPPIAAEEFYEFIHGKRAPKLNNTKFSVLALGDRSYVHFCKTGKDVDQRLEELGAERILPRIDCDVEFQASASGWIDQVINRFSGINGFASASPSYQGGGKVAESLPEVEWSKSKPFKAKLLDKIKLNGRGSEKETFHYELSLENSGLTYEPGDALGVYGTNSERLVNEFIEAFKLDPFEKVLVDSSEFTLKEALTRKVEISTLSSDVLQKYNQFAKSLELDEILADSQKLQEFMYGRDLLDVLAQYPVTLTSGELTGILRKLQPRLYSISSSNSANPDEVHLTVSTVRYQKGRYKEGTTSSFLSDRVGEDQEIEVFVERNPEFRLPADTNAPIIMVGPGTGIAPFRAFLQERETVGAKGKNWLFFGDRHFTTDYLYQTELLNYHKKGLLTNLNVAFSRDSDKKVYVQHKMQEHSKELFAWLEEGAYFYVCGDMKHMWKDVNKSLTEIISREGNFTEEEATDYIKKLKRSKRYQVDVY